MINDQMEAMRRSAAVGQKIRLKYEMRDGDDILPAGRILIVRVSNRGGVCAYGADRVLHMLNHDNYEIMPKHFVVDFER